MKNVWGKARMLLVALAVAVAMAVPALATDNSQTAGTADVQTVVSAVDTVSALMSAVINLIVGNPILVVFLAVSFVGVGVSVFKRVRGASGGGH